MNFLLLTFALSLHLACMNVASAGPLVCVWLDWREHRGGVLAGRVGRRLAWWSLMLFLTGMLLGGLVAWLAWTGAFWRELLDRLPSRIYWGAWELAFSAGLLGIYWAWWRLAPGGGAARAVRSLLAAAAGTNLMYHFPPLFVAAALLSAGKSEAVAELNDDSFRRIIWQGEVFALTVHFWFASLAAVGVLLAGFAVYERKEEATPEDASRLAAWGGRLALVPTLLQIPVGLWIVTQFPVLRQNRLLGDDLAATALLGAGVLAALWLMHILASLSMGETQRKTVLRAAVLMLAVIVLMTAALRRSRPESRNLTSSPADLELHGAESCAGPCAGRRGNHLLV